MIAVRYSYPSCCYAAPIQARVDRSYPFAVFRAALVGGGRGDESRVWGRVADRRRTTADRRRKAFYRGSAMPACHRRRATNCLAGLGVDDLWVICCGRPRLALSRGPNFGPKRPATCRNETGLDRPSPRSKTLKRNTFRHRMARGSTAASEFRDRPVRRGHGRSCCYTGLVRGLVLGGFVQQPQRVVGLSCISCLQRGKA
jgi:hypothetical protein